MRLRTVQIEVHNAYPVPPRESPIAVQPETGLISHAKIPFGVNLAAANAVAVHGKLRRGIKNERSDIEREGVGQRISCLGVRHGFDHGQNGKGSKTPYCGFHGSIELPGRHPSYETLVPLPDLRWQSTLFSTQRADASNHGDDGHHTDSEQQDRDRQCERQRKVAFCVNQSGAL